MVVSFSSSTADLDTKHSRRTTNDDHPSIAPTSSGNIRPIATVLSMPASPPQSFSVISSSSSSTSSSPRSHTRILAHSHSRPQASSSRSSASTTPSLSPSSIISLQRTTRQTKKHLPHPSTQQRPQVHFVPGQNRSALLYTSAQLEEQQKQQKLQQKELERQRRQQQQQQNNEKMELGLPAGRHSSKSGGPRSRLSRWAASIRHTFSPKSKSNKSASSTPVTTLCSGGPIVSASSPLSSDIAAVATAAATTTATTTTTTTTTIEAIKAEHDSSQPLHDLDHELVPPPPSSAVYTLEATSPQSQQQHSQQQPTAHNVPQAEERKAAPVAQEKSSKKPKMKSSFPRWSSSSFSTPKNTAAAGTAAGFDPSTTPFPSSTKSTPSPISPSPYCPDDQPRIRLRNQKRRRRVGAGLITIFCIAAIVILVLC